VQEQAPPGQRVRPLVGGQVQRVEAYAGLPEPHDRAADMLGQGCVLVLGVDH
jgi:hypothetical protein